LLAIQGIFAGSRLDSFFMDVPREVETRKTRRIAFQAQGTNTLDGLNVLSIVLELDVASVLGRASGTLFAVAAETVAAGEAPRRLERLGRAEVKNILLSTNGVDMVNECPPRQRAPSPGRARDDGVLRCCAWSGHLQSLRGVAC
jgi:hypothetical protein